MANCACLFDKTWNALGHLVFDVPYGLTQQPLVGHPHLLNRNHDELDFAILIGECLPKTVLVLS